MILSKECEAGKEIQESLRKEVASLKKENQALKLKNQELQILMKKNEFSRADDHHLSDRKPDGATSTESKDFFTL